MRRLTGWILVLLLFLSAFLEVRARASGPPLSEGGTFDMICNQLMPNHGGQPAQAGNGGYIIITNIPRSGSTSYEYMAGQTYTVTLRGTLSGTRGIIRGFIVKAHVPGQDQELLGAFTPQSGDQQTLNCDSMGAATAATVAHRALINSNSTMFTWQAPSGSDGTVDFSYSVVQSFSIFFVRQSAAQNDPTLSSTLPIEPLGITISLTTETLDDSVAMLSQIIEFTENNTNEQTNEVLSSVANFFEELVDFVNESNVIINTTIIADVVQVVNSLLQWEPVNIMVTSSSRIVQSFETVVSTYAQQLTLNETQNFITPSLTLVAELRSVDSLSQSGRSFSIGDNALMLGSEDQVEPGQLPAQLDAAISLPASLFEQIDDRLNVGIFFALYETPNLFPVGGENDEAALPRQTVVGSQVLAATVGPGISFQNLDEPITILLRLQVEEGRFVAEGSEMCVSWDFTLLDWTTEGCITIIGEDGVVTCNCNHLTNFAVLVDICLRQEDCERSRVDQALTYISYIGTSVSIVCLVFTLLTILVFKKIREKDISKYHIQLCLGLLCMYVLTLIVVVLSAERIDTIYGGCVSLSLLVHYFTLVAVMWMGAEALLMFQKLVIVFVRITTKFIIIVSVVCWTVPILFVLIPFIVDMANGRDDMSDIIIQRAKMEDEISYCFLSHIGALVGAFLVPIFVIIFVNVISFIWVIVVVIRHAKEKANRMKQSITNKEILRITFGLTGVLFLFGLTWGFFILTFSVPGLRETFQILFTVFNSLQGFFIFAFILFTEGFDYWKALLSCKKYKSKQNQPSTPGTKSSTAPSTLPKQEKNASETSYYNDKMIEMYNKKLELNEYQFSSNIDSQTKLVGVETASPVNETDKSNILLQYQLQNDQQCIESEQQDLEGELKKQTDTKPLNVVVKRYSTKKSVSSFL